MQLILNMMNKNDKIVVEYRKKVGINIKKYRQMRKFSQDELAKTIGITPQTLCCIEKGINNPSFSVLIGIVHALDIPLANIYMFDDNEKEFLTLINKNTEKLSNNDKTLLLKIAEHLSSMK